jgi:hypothetical protein
MYAVIAVEIKSPASPYYLFNEGIANAPFTSLLKVVASTDNLSHLDDVALHFLLRRRPPCNSLFVDRLRMVVARSLDYICPIGLSSS